MTPPRRYAQHTSVSIDRSISEIQKLVRLNGATGWRYEEIDDTEPPCRMISFALQKRALRFTVTELPLSDFTFTPTGLRRPQAGIVKAREEENRRRWRAVLLYIKAAIEAMHSGVPELRHALLPFVVMEDGASVGDAVEEQFAREESRRAITLLPPAIAEETTG